MIDKLQGIEARYEELNRLMADSTGGDYSKIAEYAKERASLEEIVGVYREYRTVLKDLEGARLLLDDPSMADLAAEEVRELEKRQAGMEARLKALLIPKDPRDEKEVMWEIRAGAGCDEAGIFAADLFRMYTRYAEERGWKTEILSASDTGVGGYKEVIVQVKGRGAYSRLK